MTLEDELDALGEKVQSIHRLVDAYFKAMEQLAAKYNFADPKAKK